MYRILEWDSEFFGFTVAQISTTSEEANAGQLECVLAELRRNTVRLAYWSTRADVPGGYCAAGLGGRLVDEKTTFLVALASVGSPIANALSNDVFVEPYDSSMSKAELRELAIQSGEFSRFAIDPKIPKAKFEEMYAIWIEKSLAKEIADEVLVVRNNDGRVVGMTTLGHKNDRGDIGLLGVDAKFRGRHFGEMLVRHAQQWFIARGYKYAQVVTQGANAPACRLYAKCGFAVEMIEHFYHFWL